MGFVEIETSSEDYGIIYKGKEYVVKPLAINAKKAREIFDDEEKVQDYEELLKAIKLIIPNFPINEVSTDEVLPICNGITLALKKMTKKD